MNTEIAREAFLRSSRVFTHVPHMAVYPRILQDFAPLEVLRSANYEKWREIRFDTLEKNGLGMTIADRNDYATFVQVKTANNSTFDILVAAFPHGNNKITHTADELPTQTQEDIFNVIELTCEAIRTVADKTNQPLKRIYVGEQFFFDELNTFPFKNTFPQTHFHVSGITYEDFNRTTKPTYEDFYNDDQVKHVFRDPTIFVVQDLYKEMFPDENPIVDINTASLIISKDPVRDHFRLPQESRKKYLEIMEGFKEKYRELALCYTAFEKDGYARNIPLDKAKRVNNVQQYIQNHPSLSQNSKLILQHLAENLESFDPQKLYRAFYNNFAGHIGWTYNLEDNTITLRFAPRAFTESHGYGETDGDYFVIKDRSINLSNDKKSEVLDTQRHVIQTIGTLITK